MTQLHDFTEATLSLSLISLKRNHRKLLLSVNAREKAASFLPMENIRKYMVQHGISWHDSQLENIFHSNREKWHLGRSGWVRLYQHFCRSTSRFSKVSQWQGKDLSGDLVVGWKRLMGYRSPNSAPSFQNSFNFQSIGVALKQGNLASSPVSVMEAL